jgi:DNA repair exonuclease SbcCD ATPase subunit
VNTLKIHSLEIENVKRVRAVSFRCEEDGLMVIGGRNGQGKTSVLDAIAWALGGNKHKPSAPNRDGSAIPARLRVTLNNGLVVERSGKNGDLKITDPQGKKSGQQLLDGLISQLALDLPKFLQSSAREKADILLKIIGVGDQLAALERDESESYARRHEVGRIADQKSKYAKEQPFYPDVPEDIVSASDLIKKQQDILAENGENQRKRARLAELESAQQRVQRELDDVLQRQAALMRDLEIARKTAQELTDQSTTELEESISKIEEINRKVRANLDRAKALDDAQIYANQYVAFTAEIDSIRQKKTDLLNGANLPLPELSVEAGELLYQGKKWDCISGSDQLRIATAICRQLNPACGFVLMDKLEQMDTDTLREFGQWLRDEGLQVIATRVSVGDECSIVIEDGYIAQGPKTAAPTPEFKKGVF